MTAEITLEKIGQHIDLSRIDMTHEEMLAEVIDCRAAEQTIEDMIETFAKLLEEQKTPDQFFWDERDGLCYESYEGRDTDF